MGLGQRSRVFGRVAKEIALPIDGSTAARHVTFLNGCRRAGKFGRATASQRLLIGETTGMRSWLVQRIGRNR